MGMLDGQCTETLTVKRKTSHTIAGDPTRGTTLTVLSRIERQADKATMPDGTQLSYNARVFTQAPDELKLSDLLFFPEDSTADNEAGREIARVEQIRDLDGLLDHWEIYL